MADEATTTEAPPEGSEDIDDVNLDDIAPDTGGDQPDPWAEPPELEEGVDQFDRGYVETVRKQAADYRTRAREYADAVGDLPLTDVKAAHELVASLQTEPGVIEMFYNTGKALGLGVRDMEKLFASDAAPAEPEAPETHDDDDEVLTKAELRAALAEQAREAAKQQHDLAEQGARQAATNALTSAFSDLKVTDETEKAEIMVYGEKHLPPDTPIPSPEQVDSALRQGYDEWQKATEKRVQQYIERKRAQKQQSPKTLGENAGAAAETASTEKRTLQQVIEARRERERANRS